MEIDKNLRGHALAFTTNVMWGLISPIDKSASTEFLVLSVTTFRTVGTAAAFWILPALCKQEQTGHRDMLKISFASLFTLVFNQGISMFGLSPTSPIDASIVTTISPITTMTVAVIYLKESVTNKKALGIFIGAMEAPTLTLGSQATSAGGGSIWGDLFCMIA